MSAPNGGAACGAVQRGYLWTQGRVTYAVLAYDEKIAKRWFRMSGPKGSAYVGLDTRPASAQSTTIVLASFDVNGKQMHPRKEK
jgi:hypothetical protein